MDAVRFPAPPHVHQRVDDHDLYDLESVYSCPRIDAKRSRFCVKPPFVTDLASIPWWAWSAIRVTPSRASGPAVAHDALCRMIDPDDTGAYARRAAADAYFLWLLYLWGLRRWQCWAMFLSLRLHAMSGAWRNDCNTSAGEPWRQAGLKRLPWYRRWFKWRVKR